ncbi:MAG: hypothetical protein CV087_15630 [Candidatus Brocadia sp. WS118]|nr:MAG: hypothetical protein CV087_15630 [Candidatus Brocadia sp. WS118]
MFIKVMPNYERKRHYGYISRSSPGLAEKARYPISFKKFIVSAVPVTIGTIIILTIYVWLRYYIIMSSFKLSEYWYSIFTRPNLKMP